MKDKLFQGRKKNQVDFSQKMVDYGYFFMIVIYCCEVVKYALFLL